MKCPECNSKYMIVVAEDRPNTDVPTLGTANKTLTSFVIVCDCSSMSAYNVNKVKRD